MKQRIEGKVIVITGASSGFGRGIALACAREGASVVLAARRSDALEEVARLCRAHGVEALAIPTDVSVEDEVRQLAGTALDEAGRIDVWINNAGVGAIGPFDAVPIDIHAQVIATDLMGVLYGSYHAYRVFLDRGAGTLINVASELGMHTVPYYASYAAAKHGVVGLTEALQQEIDQRNLSDIHACLVLPTAHDTPFFDHVANYTGREVQAPDPLHDPKEVIDAILDLIRNPKDDRIVGSDGMVKILMKRLAPALAEKMGGKQMHKTQIEKAPPGTDSPGAVEEPVERGTGVSGGRRARR